MRHVSGALIRTKKSDCVCSRTSLIGEGSCGRGETLAARVDLSAALGCRRNARRYSLIGVSQLPELVILALHDWSVTRHPGCRRESHREPGRIDARRLRKASSLHGRKRTSCSRPPQPPAQAPLNCAMAPTGAGTILRSMGAGSSRRNRFLHVF